MKTKELNKRYQKASLNSIPNFANCLIQFKDDKTTQEVVIALSSNSENINDEEIFFYCENFEEFVKLTNADNGEDFAVIGDVEFFK